MNKLGSNPLKFLCLILLFPILLISCKSSPPDPTVAVTQLTLPEATEKSVEPTPIPLPEPLRICLNNEPSSLYPYGDNSPAALAIRAAIYDGPFDNLSYELKPVILEKMPSLADGDANIKTVVVSTGDLIHSENRPRILETGMLVRPAGCNATDCEIEYIDGEIEMDQMEVRFTLLPNLLWSDGAPLIASDSVYAYELAKDPDTPVSKSKLRRTASYSALDQQTLVWVGIPGYLDPEYANNFWAPMPQHLWGEMSAADLLTNEISVRTPIGWGAYLIEEWIPGESIQLKSNPNYFRVAEGLPKTDSLIFRFIGDDIDGNITALHNGECDILASSPELYEHANQLIELQKQGELLTSFASGKSWEVLDIGINPSSYDNGYSIYSGDRPAFFSDSRTRQALAYCIDRQSIVDRQLFGQSIVLDSYLPPQHPLFNPNTSKYPFDPDKGISLLEQVGWMMGENNLRIASGIKDIPDGTAFEINFWTTSGLFNHRQKTAEKIAANLSACGVKVNLEIYTPEALYAKAPEGPLFGRNYDLAQYPWQVKQTPACNLYLSDGIAGNLLSRIIDVPWLSSALPNANPTKPAFPWAWGGWNSSGFVDPDYDEVCSSALAALPGMEVYEINHLLAQEIFSEKLPVIPLYLSLEVAAARTDICNFYLDPTAQSEFWNIEAIAFGEYCPPN